jgi:hypothetical protein
VSGEAWVVWTELGAGVGDVFFVEPDPNVGAGETRYEAIESWCVLVLFEEVAGVLWFPDDGQWWVVVGRAKIKIVEAAEWQELFRGGDRECDEAGLVSVEVFGGVDLDGFVFKGVGEEGTDLGRLKVVPAVFMVFGNDECESGVSGWGDCDVRCISGWLVGEFVKLNEGSCFVLIGLKAVVSSKDGDVGGV